MILSQAGRLATQAVYFVIVARALGPHQFGEFAGVLAVVSVASPFAAAGAGNLLVMHVAREPRTFSRLWGTALAAIPVAGVPLLAIVVGSSALLFPNLSLRLVLSIGIAEFFFARLAETAAQAFQAFERLRVSAVLWFLPSAARCVAGVLFALVASSGSGAVGWSYWYLGASAAASLVTLAVAVGMLGRPGRGRPSLRGVSNGLYFSLAQSSANVYNDIDKAMLARLATLAAAGVYAAAYRAVSLAFVPVQSLLYATYARFFRRGAEGINGSLRFAWRLLPFTVAYAGAVSLALFAAAPLAADVLGSGYGDAPSVMRWLAPLPVIQACYYLAGDTLTGAGFQRARSVLQLGAAALNIGLNLWLIPQYSWRGAAFATLLSLTLLAAAMWIAVGILALGERRRPGVDDAYPGLARV